MFSVVQPEMSKEMERKVREEVRACSAGEGCYKTLGLTQGRRLWYNSQQCQDPGDIAGLQSPLGVPLIALTAQEKMVVFEIRRSGVSR